MAFSHSTNKRSLLPIFFLVAAAGAPGVLFGQTPVKHLRAKHRPKRQHKHQRNQVNCHLLKSRASKHRERPRKERTKGYLACCRIIELLK